jgi:hypothetical protein
MQIESARRQSICCVALRIIRVGADIPTDK